MWFENFVDKVEISDLSRRKRDRTGVIGLSPNLPNAVESQFIQVGETADIVNHFPEENWIYDEGGLNLGEYLYSAEGYQTAGISGYNLKNLNLDPKDKESRFLLDVYSEKYGNKFYEMRPAFALQAFSSF